MKKQELPKVEKSLNYNERFSGEIGEEYRLFKEAVPSHEQFQDTIRDVLKKHFAQILGTKEMKVVEAGCGTGFTTVRIMDADPRIKVVAVDNEAKMIAQAQEVLHDFAERIEFVQSGILEALEKLEDSSVEAFASAYTLHNLPKEYRAKVLQQIKRVLKDGGIFINADKYANDDPDQHQKDLELQIKSFDVFDALGKSKMKEDWIKHYHEDEKIKITEAEQRVNLQELGFEDIKTIFRERMEAIITAVCNK